MVQIVIPAPAIKCELASRLFRENIQPPSLQHEFGKDQLCESFTTDGGDIFIQKTPSPDDGHMRINWNRSALFFRAASCFGWPCRVVHCVRLYGFGFVAVNSICPYLRTFKRLNSIGRMMKIDIHTDAGMSGFQYDM